mgnify:CR=1 FL=1
MSHLFIPATFVHFGNALTTFNQFKTYKIAIFIYLYWTKSKGNAMALYWIIYFCVYL